MTRISPAFPIVAGALTLTFLWVVAWYWPTATEVAGIWWRSDTFAHGLIVLPAFAWLTWRARDRIGDLQPQPVAWMAVPILAAGLLWLLGSLVSVAAAQHFALFVMLVPLPTIVLDVLLPPARTNWGETEKSDTGAHTRQIFRKKLREGELDDKEIEIEVAGPQMGVEIMAPPGMEEMTNQLQGLFQNMSSGNTRKRKLKVKEALKQLVEEEAARLLNPEELKEKTIHAVENNGIVFIDEIDKICKRGESSGPDVSREGVQRDLLPLVEGCTVNTKHGMVKTDHILFIASGAFQIAKPSDLIPELQGRLPIRVELKSLTVDDFERILTEPNASLTEQYRALMATEQVTVEFTPDGIRSIAEAAWKVNERTENIGARRLHTVLEKLMEDISYDAADNPGQVISIDAAYVDRYLGELVEDEDLSRFIL